MTYNPSILDLLYLKLIPQGSLMTFRKVYYTGSNAISNIWAKTSDGWSQWATFLTTTIVWNLLQTYSSILTNTINPIGGTLTIGNTAVNTNVEVSTQTGRTSILRLGNGSGSTGNIHIGNGLGSLNQVQILHGSSGVLNLGSATSTNHLYSPLTPIQTYSITPFTPTSGTVNYGTVGTIGHIIVASQNNGNITATGIAPTNPNLIWCAGFFSNLTISVPQGVWILQLEFVTTVIFGLTIGLSFGTTPLPAGETRVLTTKKAGMFGCKYAAWNNSSTPNVTILSYNQTLCHYTNTTGTNVNIYGFLNVNGYGYVGQRATMTAVRIA
jgi:hypothetical protein